MPPENFHAGNKKDKAGCPKNCNWHNCFRKTSPFDHNAANPVGHHGKWKFLDGGDAPFREIMITEKYSGENHHGHGDKVDKPVSDFCLGCMR